MMADDEAHKASTSDYVRPDTRNIVVGRTPSPVSNAVAACRPVYLLDLGFAIDEGGPRLRRLSRRMLHCSVSGSGSLLSGGLGCVRPVARPLILNVFLVHDPLVAQPA